MYEKISEIPIREAKVKKLKEKIYLEIDEFLKCERKKIINLSDTNKENSERWNSSIIRQFCLLKLKEYVDSDDAFQTIIKMCRDKDIIIYQVLDEDLNIWLQKDYSFTLNFLCNLKSNVYRMLNDRYFGYEFTSLFDKIRYKEKLKQRREGYDED